MATLENFVEKLKEPTQDRHTRAALPVQLIAHATASAPDRPLTEHQARIVNDLFPSIRDLERGTRTAEGQDELRAQLNPATAKDIIDFWEDEWIV